MILYMYAYIYIYIGPRHPRYHAALADARALARPHDQHLLRLPRGTITMLYCNLL